MMGELFVLLDKLITREASMHVVKRMSIYALGDSSNCALLPYAYIPTSFLSLNRNSSFLEDSYQLATENLVCARKNISHGCPLYREA